MTRVLPTEACVENPYPFKEKRNTTAIIVRPSVDGLCYSCTMAAHGLRGWRARVATVHRPRGRSPSGSMNQKPRALPRKAQAKRHRTSVLYDT